ncbi:MAG: flagellar basal body-associated FliL family protein [Syntrophothermus sp.]
MSSKTVDQLNSFTFKDTLKTEISKSIVKKFPKVKISNIYFPKFIIQ